MKDKRLPSPPYNPGVRDLVANKRSGARPITIQQIKRGFKGWHEAGYLPHRDEPGLVQFVTFRLADSFPDSLRHEWEHLLKIAHQPQRQIALEDYLDRGGGECFLNQAEIARVVERALMFRHGTAYDLRGWVIMPNHVHVLFQVLDMPMWLVIDAWKGYTAKEANKLLARKGRFWQEGYWDTYIRDPKHEIRARHYIERNPTKAGLVTLARDWPWSSARLRDAYERLCFPEA